MNTYIDKQEKRNSLNKQFYFLRHGETEWNTNRILMGQADISLNHRGRQQAEEIAKTINKHPYGKVYSSPLIRAYETAKIATQIKGPKIELLNGLKERAFPIGMLHDDLENISSDNLSKPFEIWSKFSTRISTTLDYILVNNQQAPLIVAHGGVLVAICQSLIVELPTIENCKLLLFKQYNNYLWTIENII